MSKEQKPMSDESRKHKDASAAEVDLVRIFEVDGRLKASVDTSLPRALEVLNAIAEDVRCQLAIERMRAEADRRLVQRSLAGMVRGAKLS
jgi:hypothetical protein